MMVLAKGNAGVISTLEIVEQINFFRAKEGRKILRHDNLMSVVREEFNAEISLLKIQESEYVNSRGKKYPMFELTFNQAKQILIRESSTVRRAIIEYIDRLEQELRLANRDSYMIEDPVERALRWAEEKRHSMALEHTVDILTHTDKTYTATELANELGFKSAQKFNAWLSDCGFQRRVNGTWVTYAKFAEDGFIEVKQEVVKEKEVYHRKFTQKGREYIIRLLEDYSGKKTLV